MIFKKALSTIKTFQYKLSTSRLPIYNFTTVDQRKIENFEIKDREDDVIQGNHGLGIYVTLPNGVGILRRILEIISKHNINLTQIETKLLNRNQQGNQDVIFRINYEGTTNSANIQKCIEDLQKFATVMPESFVPTVPWFPVTFDDIDYLGKQLIESKEKGGENHPLFKDSEYKKRRDKLAEISKRSRIRDKIPYIDYNENECRTWKYIYEKIRPLQRKYMCKEFNDNLDKIEKYCGKGPDKISQLGDISTYLENETGFRLKPVHGILSQREFLNALAHRVFCCTQYIRHHDTPEYTPEPDIIHELLGHAPMFADKEFAELSQQIGLYSLGASEDQIAKLGALYWYTVEFGACKENGDIKAYGAGIASSLAELEYFGQMKAEFRRLDPQKELPLDYPIQTFQPKYYVADSFKHANDVLIQYGESLHRPFQVWYCNISNKVMTSRNLKTRAAEEKDIYSDLVQSSQVLQSYIQ